MINQFPDMDTYFTEINHVLLASRGYEYDGFLFSILFLDIYYCDTIKLKEKEYTSIDIFNLRIIIYNTMFVISRVSPSLQRTLIV
jgi:hypothetical protein